MIHDDWFIFSRSLQLRGPWAPWPAHFSPFYPQKTGLSFFSPSSYFFSSPSPTKSSMVTRSWVLGFVRRQKRASFSFWIQISYFFEAHSDPKEKEREKRIEQENIREGNFVRCTGKSKLGFAVNLIHFIVFSIFAADLVKVDEPQVWNQFVDRV